MTFGFGVIRVTQENLRATQIMVEKLESIRLCTWEQLNTPGFVPRKFAALYYDGVSNANGSLTYSGTVTVSNAPPSESYATDLRFVTVDLAWTSGQSTRQRSMTAMISQYGIQNYKY